MLTIQGERVLHSSRYGSDGVGGIVSFAFEVPPNQTDLDFQSFGLTSLTLPEGLTNLETLNLYGNNLQFLTLPKGWVRHISISAATIYHP